MRRHHPVYRHECPSRISARMPFTKCVFRWNVELAGCSLRPARQPRRPERGTQTHKHAHGSRTHSARTGGRSSGDLPGLLPRHRGLVSNVLTRLGGTNGHSVGWRRQPLAGGLLVAARMGTAASGPTEALAAAASEGHHQDGSDQARPGHLRTYVL